MMHFEEIERLEDNNLADWRDLIQQKAASINSFTLRN